MEKKKQVHRQKNNFLEVQINQKSQWLVYEKKESTFSQGFKPGSNKTALFPTKLSLQGTGGKFALEQDMPQPSLLTTSLPEYLTAVKTR